ncbi:MULTISPECIES: ParB/RepB/Spo0J family partition protein [unclassified Pseudodesulfovibrio]|uniref:ParB/RepB/Spo0J family partition protein n=1 Tax=unclassified Pseudodesulfovibrio TaxID=2661612 RepID=UPI000FEB848B|nr:MULTISPECIES: ParB/RepB/Spo0J family partition protein [unclassified Pseudodesulfovibrio]MCJ2165168.1 ParB/RepB/Spo0J family partition protein [Pseudodesulfovibrio sp. S3-i]RWU03454.1 ParB/RepB/Spo0J family partition protein [Pseudodesulfovibrio sp. S3]
MTSSNRGLGRGLDALLGGVRQDEKVTSDAAEVRMIPVGAIVPNPHQPRREFSEEGLNDLAASIRTRGVLQPVLVRPLGGDKYELVAGERRLRASKKAELTEIPTLVREMTDQESLAIALIENLQREDLNAIEEALGYQQLQQEFGLSQEELARQVGKSRSAVANSLRLLNLPEVVQTDIQQNTLSAGHGRAIMSIKDAEAQEQLHRRIAENGLTVRQAEAQATFYKQNGRLPGADEIGVPSGSGSVKTPSKPLEPRLLDLQAALSDLLNLKVKIVGSMEKGKLTVAYGVEEDLRSVAGKLGVEFE